MARRVIHKRKADTQLSPYTNDEDDLNVNQDNFEDDKELKPIKKAQISRNKSNNSSHLKGIFSKKLAVKQTTSTLKKTNDKMAGLNKCFKRAIQKVLDKKSNVDLTYIFTQYNEFKQKILTDES